MNVLCMCKYTVIFADLQTHVNCSLLWMKVQHGQDEWNPNPNPITLWLL